MARVGLWGYEPGLQQQWTLVRANPPALDVPLPGIALGGEWTQQCTSGRTCTMTTAKTYTFTSEFSESYTEELQRSIEAMVSTSTTGEAGYEGAGASAKLSSTFTASLTTGLSDAVTNARASSNGNSQGLSQSFECPLVVLVGKLGYLWESHVRIGDNTARVLHCLDACSAEPPTWGPGDPEHIKSCNK